jgi:hypothetical protein
MRYSSSGPVLIRDKRIDSSPTTHLLCWRQPSRQGAGKPGAFLKAAATVGEPPDLIQTLGLLSPKRSGRGIIL